ncbi:hypothetical protein KHG57_000208 [Listeria monocytogenes]|uniref:hypothetical protein n=1 Tax=Listeria monocytogenes TaxID=1639 RepID=UPI001356946B|nr:hypothetical protein [Listeria monocytogenes]EHN0623998.1 hypothetical protein [Listeria monocytogenes]
MKLIIRIKSKKITILFTKAKNTCYNNFVILGKGPVLSQLKLVLFLEEDAFSGEKKLFLYKEMEV